MEFSHSFGLVFPLLSYKSGNMRKFTENQAQGHDNDIQKKLESVNHIAEESWQ